MSLARLACRLGLHRWSPCYPIGAGCYHKCLRPGCTAGTIRSCR